MLSTDGVAGIKLLGHNVSRTSNPDIPAIDIVGLWQGTRNM